MKKERPERRSGLRVGQPILPASFFFDGNERLRFAELLLGIVVGNTLAEGDNFTLRIQAHGADGALLLLAFLPCPSGMLYDSGILKGAP